VPRFHEHEGVTLAFEAAGSGDPPMVFVHGWLCDRSHFAPQLEHFAARHAAVGMDLPGHGDSGRPSPDGGRYRIDAFANDVLAVASAAGCECPVVVGHSLGAVVALACAARPDAVRAAVMVDCTPILDRAAKSFLSSAAVAIEGDTDGEYRRQFFAGMFLPTDTVRRDEIIAASGAEPGPIAAAAIKGLIDFDAAAAFGAVRVPVLSIRSGLPGDAPSDLQAACPTITIGQTVGAGHFIQLEVPEQVNHMIERFLAVNDL
jgi:pimeloyl-ACP methyl ester carboxylesterase